MKQNNRFDRPDKYRLSHFFQAIPAYILYFIFWCLPLDWASDLGGWLGRKIGPRLGASKKALVNLNYALPELSKQHDNIVKQMWDNLGRVFAEAAHTKIFRKGKRVEVIGIDYIEHLNKQKEPAIIFSSHSANWEVGPATLWAHVTPMNVVYRPPNNLFIDALIHHSRRNVSPKILPKGKDAARGVIKALKNNEMIGWLLDQKESAGTDNVTFFGKPAYTSTAAAEIALRTGAKLIPSQTERLNGANFRITLSPPLETEGKNVEEITQMINNTLENHIRQNPGQWLWLHRRWIF